MSSDPHPPEDPAEETPESWGWTSAHRLGIGILTAILLGFLFYQFLSRPKRLDDSLVIIRGQSATLPQLMDPNTATAEELARIPGVGVKTAEAIVRYREVRKNMAEDGKVFLRASDLARIPGVAKKVPDAVKGYLAFPEEDSPPVPVESAPANPE